MVCVKSHRERVCQRDGAEEGTSKGRSDWFHIWNAFKLCGTMLHIIYA